MVLFSGQNSVQFCLQIGWCPSVCLSFTLFVCVCVCARVCAYVCVCVWADFGTLLFLS
jgi:hypothetical protein